jgi:hypothetical protein
MNRTILARSVLSSLLLVAFATLPERSAAWPPQPIFPNVTGFWSGEFASDRGETAVATLDIPAQEHRRFGGTFVFFPPSPIVPPNPCAVLGTVSASGEVSMVGRNEDFFLHIHGLVDDDVMSLEYMRLFVDGTFETGTVSIGLETGGGGGT